MAIKVLVFGNTTLVTPKGNNMVLSSIERRKAWYCSMGEVNTRWHSHLVTDADQIKEILVEYDPDFVELKDLSEWTPANLYYLFTWCHLHKAVVLTWISDGDQWWPMQIGLFVENNPNQPNNDPNPNALQNNHGGDMNGTKVCNIQPNKPKITPLQPSPNGKRVIQAASSARP